MPGLGGLYPLFGAPELRIPLRIQSFRIDFLYGGPNPLILDTITQIWSSNGVVF